MTATRKILYGLLVLVVLLDLALLIDGWNRLGDAGEDWGAVAARLILIPATFAILAQAMRRGPRPHELLPSVRSAFWLRAFLWAVFAGFLAASLANLDGTSTGHQRAFFATSLAVSLNLWAVGVLLWPGATTQGRRALAFVDLVVTNLLVGLVLVELLLAVWVSVSPSPLLAAEARLEVGRMPPDNPYFDFRCNASGYYDTEFFAAEEDDRVVVLLADSFGLGVVPYHDNFSSVAERILRQELAGEYGRIAIHNLGVAGIGLPEYLRLVETEVEQWNPAGVVLAVFVGNDIVDDGRKKRRRYRLQDWWLSIAARRILLVHRELRRGAAVTRIGQSPPSGEVDPERPTFSEETFLRIERNRAAVLDPDHPEVQAHYRRFFDQLDLIHGKLGERLSIVVIPDEFQVNDDLYAILGRADARRDLPQRRIAKFCSSRDIPMLDLLPALRSAEALGRTYRLRDTHWNARGNRIAGEEIAAFLRVQLGGGS